MKKTLKNIPSIQEILSSSEIQSLLTVYRYDIIKKISIQSSDTLRQKIIKHFHNYENCTKKDLSDEIISYVKLKLNNIENHNYKKVINATGIAIHTNLGRSPIDFNSLQKSSILSSSYMNIEYDISSSKRCDRNSAIIDIIKLLTSCEDALLVNNNAAALLLIFNTFVKNKNAIISRGELIEIGDNFRLLDIISNTSLIKEVGSTNRTNIKDYENAIDNNTSLIIKASKSNYEITGFVEEVSSRKLANLSKKNNIIFVEDLGSGNITDISQYGFNYERTVSDSLKDGADMVCFSTDKLMGSCQAGIIAGDKKYIQILRQNPLFRALRLGKYNIVTLYETLKLYTYNDFQDKIPILKIIFTKKEVLYNKAKKLYALLDKSMFEYIKIQESTAYVGGGVSSNLKIDSYALSLKAKNISTSNFEKILRQSKYHIIGYIKYDKLYLDMLCIFDDEIKLIADKIFSLKNEINISS